MHHSEDFVFEFVNNLPVDINSVGFIVLVVFKPISGSFYTKAVGVEWLVNFVNFGPSSSKSMWFLPTTEDISSF
jgi:hypothetical protein